MREDFLQYVWKNGLYKNFRLRTTTGKEVVVKTPGIRNRDAGPDFLFSCLEIEGVEIYGNIEIHMRNSDWYKHAHHKNPAYDNVILSVVRYADIAIYNRNKCLIESLELEFADNLLKEYEYIKDCMDIPKCGKRLNRLSPSRLNEILRMLAMERLEAKASNIKSQLENTKNDLEECFYRLLFKYWGGNLNSEAFYRLACILPYRILIKNVSDQKRLEALLFGCSGLLVAELTDAYSEDLRKEFAYLSRKYRLNSMSASEWRFMRARPMAFPTLRMAMAAAYLRSIPMLARTIIETSDIETVKKQLNVRASGYWDRHFQFGKMSVFKIKRMGAVAQRTIVVNAVIPFVYMYGKLIGESSYTDKAVHWLECEKPEKNSVVSAWERSGIELRTALDTQAVTELSKVYCTAGNCADCRIIREILSNS